MAFGLDVTFSAMHIQVKFVGLMVAITDMYRGWLARLMVGRRNLQRQARQEMNRLKKYNFKDDHGHPLENCDDYQTILTALEAAEARAEKAEDYAEKLVYAVTDGNLSNSYDVQVVADEVSRIWQSYTNQKVAAVRAEAEAESARLRAERDWLAGSLAEDGCPYLAFWADFEGDMRPDWCICTDTADDGFDCTGDPKECWQQEAASRAVAESEVGK